MLQTLETHLSTTRDPIGMDPDEQGIPMNQAAR